MLAARSSWSRKTSSIFGGNSMKRVFLGATAAAIAALTQQSAEAAKPSETSTDQKADRSLAPEVTLPDAISAKAPTTYAVGTEMFGFVIDRSEAGELFAYHTSHVSHASHRSHSSHYSAR
jgi:hypothetical protein